MYKKQIEEYIDSHRQEMLDDLAALCRINSEKMPASQGKPYGEGPYQALKAALALAEKYGFTVKNYDNYVGTIDLNDQEAQLDILAHLDIVPAGEGWTVTEAFNPVEKDGKLYGRGTSDDKGPAIAALYALRAVKELGIPVQKRARLILGTDEECGSSDIEYYYKKEQEAPMTFSPDGEFPVVNVEKGRLNGEFDAQWTPSQADPALVWIHAGVKANVVPGKTRAMVRGFELKLLEEIADRVQKKIGIQFHFETQPEGTQITAEGKNSHASLPQDGNNALTGLLYYLTCLPFAPCAQIETLKALYNLMPHGDVRGESFGVAMSDELSGELTLAFSMLDVDENGLKGVFDTRCPICANEDNVLRVMKEKMAAAGITLHNDSMVPPHHVDGDSHFVKTLNQVYERYSGLPGGCVSMGGGTYVHHIQNGVAFGACLPGTDTKMHGPDEFMVIDELLLSAKIFAQVIAELCGE